MDQNNKFNRIWDLAIILLLFFIAAAIRAIPEIIGGYWPIGYDTFNTYVPELTKFNGDWLNWLLSANLLYFLIWPFQKFGQIDTIILVKIFGSVIYGGLTASTYIFCRKFLQWNKLASFLVSVFLIFQIPALRLSWDLLRNMLALIFFLPGLYFLKTNSTIRNIIILGILSILIVLSNQLVAVVWFVVAIVWIIAQLLQKDWKNATRIVLASLPAIGLFYLVARYTNANNFDGHLIYVSETNRVLGYFELYKSNAKYQDLNSTIFSLFWLYYKFTLPLALIGFYLLRKNLILTTLTTWLLVGSFSSLLFGGFGIFVWDRWMLMLVFPFTIYAVFALTQFNDWVKKNKILQSAWQKKAYALISFASVTLALSYSCWYVIPFLTANYDDSRAPFYDEKINSYFPPSMIHNAVGYEHIPAVLANISYLNDKLPRNAVLVVDNRYRGMVMTQLDLTNRIVYASPWSSKINTNLINSLRENYLGPIYLIWSTYENVDGFKRIYYSQSISVYRDKETFKQYLLNN